ncbi:hypothetical protein [Flavobacterium arsenatis]|nr:hypothetical protein [Flavobacterium arsenatis]
MSKIKTKVVETFGADKKVYSLSIDADDHLSLDWGSCTIDYLESGKDFSQRFSTTPSEKLAEPKADAIQNELMQKNKQGSVAIKDLKFDLINAKFNEAMKLVPAEYESLYLHSFTFNVDNDNKVTAYFTIEGKKKGESAEIQGKRISINYYEFKFKMDENEKISIKD